MQMSQESLARPLRGAVFPATLGVWAAAIALAPSPASKLILFLPGVAAAIIFWILLRPSRWLYLLFFCLLALPPFPARGGDSGLHIAPLAGGIGVLVGLLRPHDWRNLKGRLPLAFAGFLTVLLLSTGFAAAYSGTAIAAGTLIRVLLFALGVYVFAYTLATRSTDAPDPIGFTRFLILLATTGAIFACIDFYFQLPAPAGYGPQFVWLAQGVFRRAQGLFYEASTLGNFCAFFLMLVLVCLFGSHSETPLGKSGLAACGAIFSAALIFSYSRGSLINVIVGGLALIWLRKRTPRRAAAEAWTRSRFTTPYAFAALGAVVIAAVVFVRTVLPAFSENYWSHVVGSIQYASYTPNGVLSGRLTNWMFLGDFLLREPWTAIFGIGYKTLPYSDYAGAKVVADNTYLQLLVETGIVGLLAFLALNGAILQTGLRAVRSSQPRARLFGEWIFCFWAGQMVQMLSGDLITYWRVLPVYFWVLATAAKEADASQHQ
jgi:O-antigen ligase